MLQVDETVKKIAEEFAAQNRHATALPLLIVLQQKEQIRVPDGEGDETHWHDPEDFEATFDTREEAEKWAKDMDREGEELKEFMGRLEPFSVKDVWVDRNWFLTMSGYEEHMRLNSHNYRRGEVRPYIMHAFRNPEMAAVQKLLLEIAKENGDGRTMEKTT